MLTFGVISPHPPIILPEIGGSKIQEVQKTISALEQAAKQLAAAKPDRLLIISPHEQHGYDVPLYYLGKNLASGTEVEKILVTYPSYGYYFELGKSYAQEIDASSKRTAVIASADLSHVLKADGPYGYNSAGPLLDHFIVNAVREGDVEQIFQIDPFLFQDSAECGLRSILFLFGVFADKRYSTEVLSYEGPFGVGYMVATFSLIE